jgi:hypothetical protein
MGNLGQAPELLKDKNGNPYCKFGLAERGTLKDENGEYITKWRNGILHGANAESFARSKAKPGSRLQMIVRETEWKDKDGNIRISYTDPDCWTYCPGGNGDDKPKEGAAPQDREEEPPF